MAEPRLRRCENTRELERLVDDLAIQGYKIINRSDTSALLKRNNNGSGAVHVLLFLFTLGIGNLIYWAVKRADSDSVIIKVSE